MVQNNFFSLIQWEVKEYINLPILTFLIASAIIATLAKTSAINLPVVSYLNLYYGSGMVFTILTLVAGAFFCRSFAGSIGRGETKMLLSYPVKRWKLFLSKFTAMFLPIFIIYGVVYSLHLYIDSLSIFEPMFYISIFAFFLQLLLASGVSVAISMVTKSEVTSILAAVLLLLGIDNLSIAGSYFSAQGRFQFLFQYFGELTHNNLPFGENLVVTEGDILLAVSIPILVFVFLFLSAFIYYTRYMEID